MAGKWKQLLRPSTSRSSKKNYKDVKYRECGLFIHDTKQFLGASPDLFVECSCCGKGILEVKCPFFIANDIPTDLNLD